MTAGVSTTGASLAALLVLASAAFAEPARIGVAAPLSGPSERLGRQLLAGAQAAAAAQADLTIADDGCETAGGSEAARRFVEARVTVVVGFLCTEAIEAALPILAEAGIPTITPGVRTDSLTDRRDRTGWLVWRLAPRADAEGEALARLLVREWRDELFAIVDDGTIYGRELAEGFRAAAEQAGLKPVFVDTFRPQMDNQIGLVARLRRSGATHVFVGGDRDDVAIMTRDARGLGAGITFAGGEALRAASGGVALADGTLMVGLPEWADIADPAVLSALAAADLRPEGYVLPAYAAMQVALAAAAQSPSQVPNRVDTVLGPIAFDDKGDLETGPFGLFRVVDGTFQPAEGE
jgi:branched-chain amino acid transport system substrate-binding protein